MDSDYFLSLFSNIQVLPISTASTTALFVAFVLLILSAIVSASETAFFSLTATDRNEIEESESIVDHIIRVLLQRSEYLLATILIWNNFFNVAIIVLCAYAFNQVFDFSQIPVGGFFIETIFLTLIILLLGKSIPKIYAKNDSLKLARSTASFLRVLEKISRPFSFILIQSTRFVNRSSKKKKNDVSVDELSKALELTSDEMPEEKEMLEGIIQLYRKTAVEIMTSRLDIADIDVTSSFREVIRYVIEIGYSRIPVYSGNQDNIKGILYIKDLLPYLDKPDTFRWQSLVRPAFFVPETKKIDDLLEEFRTNKTHMAIVVDEFGGTSGIVTLEDILEEIVGEINDEYDDEDTKFVQLADGSYIFDAKILLADFFRVTDIDFKVFGKLTEDADTLAGLILEIKGDFPEKREIIQYGNYSFQIVEVDKRRILKVKFTENHTSVSEKEPETT